MIYRSFFTQNIQGGFNMSITAVIGGQWGDEGKGKIVDLLSRDVSMVARFQGGANAGHTVYKGDLKIVFDDNCKYDIFKKNGKILTPGKIKIKNGTKVTYKNKAGSRGKVTLEGDTLTWKNVYTGNNYKIIVNKN